jgi:hypothetical protein
MDFRIVAGFSMAIAFSMASAFAQFTDVSTIVKNIQKNTAKVKNYSAAITLKEDQSLCTPRNVKWSYSCDRRVPNAPIDTTIIQIQNGTGWIVNSSVDGSLDELPSYNLVFMDNVMSDTFTNAWDKNSIESFNARVLAEDADSINLTHMFSSIAFMYTVDKKRWLVTRVNRGSFGLYTSIYTWAMTKDSVYYPAAIKITEDNLCEQVYSLTNIKVNGLSAAVRRDGRHPQQAGMGRTAERSGVQGVFTITGKRVSGAGIANHSSNLPNGIYLVRNANGLSKVVRWSASGKN